MKLKMTAEEFITKHIESDRIIESVAGTVDYKTNNREVKKLSKLFKIVENDIELAKQVYSNLLKHENDITRYHAAGECSRLGIYVSESEQILESFFERIDNINNPYLLTALMMSHRKRTGRNEP